MYGCVQRKKDSGHGYTSQSVKEKSFVQTEMGVEEVNREMLGGLVGDEVSGSDLFWHESYSPRGGIELNI
jgi:hypothetical protein